MSPTDQQKVLGMPVSSHHSHRSARNSLASASSKASFDLDVKPFASSRQQPAIDANPRRHCQLIKDSHLDLSRWLHALVASIGLCLWLIAAHEKNLPACHVKATSTSTSKRTQMLTMISFIALCGRLPEYVASNTLPNMICHLPSAILRLVRGARLSRPPMPMPRCDRSGVASAAPGPNAQGDST